MYNLYDLDNMNCHDNADGREAVKDASVKLLECFAGAAAVALAAALTYRLVRRLPDDSAEYIPVER